MPSMPSANRRQRRDSLPRSGSRTDGRMVQREATAGTAHTSTDAALIVAARGLRSFAYGLLAVVLSVALSQRGLAPAAIGSLITVSLAGDFCSTYLVGLGADRWGRRRTLAVLA